MAWATLTVEAGRPTRLALTSRTSLPSIAAALERMAARPPHSSDYHSGWAQWTSELPPPVGVGLTLRQPIPLEPLLDALSAAGQPTLTLVVQHPRAGFITFSGATLLASESGTSNATVSTNAPHRPIVLELGWRGADVARVAGWLLLAFFAPIVAGLAVWGRSMARDRAPQMWFLRAYSIQAILLAGWVLWLVAVEATRVADLVGLALAGRGGAGLAVVPFRMLGFLPAALALAAILRRVTRRLRGFDPQPRGMSRLLASARALVALLLLVVSITSFGAGHLKAGVFALLAGVAAGVLLPGARGPLGTRPQALSTGALRDRLFDLARRAGVKLRGLYVVPLRRERMANAFAVSGGVVMVADELLDRMSRREVDAVLAHEISHLEHHHPILTLLVAAAVGALAGMVPASLGLPYSWPVGIVMFWLTYLFVARRCEFAADAGAAALTGDPESMISSLGLLARLNEVPLAWGRGLRWLVTHPTTEARGMAIGRRAGLAPERVAELLENGLPSTERYGRRERPGEEARVFSSAWKSAMLGRLSLALLAVSVVAPAAGLALARALGLEVPPAVAYVTGAVLSLAGVLLVFDNLGARIVSRLEKALRGRLAGSSGETTAEAMSPQGDLFVALSPGDRARVYEGFLDWDLGLLTIGPHRLHYRGEQITFDLPRSSVRAIEIGAASPAWIRAPRVIVRWQGPAGEEALTLRAARSTRVSAIGRASRALAERLRAWREGALGQGADSSGQSAAGEPREVAPSMGPVTAITPAEASAPRDLPLVIVLLATLSAAAAFVLALDFWHGLEVFAAALAGLLAMRWPAMTSRERPPSQAPAPDQERRAA